MLPHLIVLIAATLVGGAIPLYTGRSHRLLHFFVAFATGLFLGIVFLHLLPEVLSAQSAGALAPPWPGLLVLLGVVVLYVLQNLVLPGRGSSDPHVAAGWGSFFGLTLHAFVAGLGLTAADAQPDVASALYVSLLVHKLAEGFSLATVFSLGGSSRRRTLVVVTAFALATPVGMLIGTGLLGALGTTGAQALSALAAGTFLFVSLGDLLPEVFHGRTDVAARLVLLTAGITAALLLHELGH